MTKQELIRLFVNGEEGKNHNAKVLLDNEATTLRLQHTDIVRVLKESGRVIIDDGGWQTNTTKSYINMALEALGLRHRILQRKGEWFLDDGSELQPFDGFKYINPFC